MQDIGRDEAGKKRNKTFVTNGMTWWDGLSVGRESELSPDKRKRRGLQYEEASQHSIHHTGDGRVYNDTKERVQ